MNFSKTIPYDSKKIIAWNYFVFILSVYLTLMIPLSHLFHLSANNPLYISMIMVSFIYFLDLLLHFHIAYRSHMQLVTDIKKIRIHYFKSYFLIDFISAIPFELIFVFNPSLLYQPIFFILSSLRVVKFIHVIKEIIANSKLKPTIYRLIFLVFFVLFFAHYISVFWVLLTFDPPYADPNFIQIMWNQYLRGFYWTLTTIITIGYGDITPDKASNIQLLFVIFVEFVGAGIYAFIIGNIANLISKLDITKANHNEKTNQINEFLKYHNIPDQLALKINDYYEYLWESRHGYNEKEVMDDLPLSLQTAVSIHLNKEMIEKVPFLQTASQELIETIILNLEPIISTPNDLIVRAGDTGNEMYFIKKGSVSVFSADGTQKYAELTEGSFFGEIALLEETTRNANIISNDYCDLYLLKRNVFNSILDSFPDFKKELQKFATARKEENKKNAKKNK